MLFGGSILNLDYFRFSHYRLGNSFCDKSPKFLLNRLIKDLGVVLASFQILNSDYFRFSHYRLGNSFCDKSPKFLLNRLIKNIVNFRFSATSQDFIKYLAGVVAVFFLFLFSSLPLKAEGTLQKSPQLLGLTVKTYAISADEQIALYGAMRRHMFLDHWYWGEFGYGAIAGIRSGYLEGGLVGGCIAPLSKSLSIDTKVMIGAGGGGSAPQGGGLLLNPSVGIVYTLTPVWSVQGDLGYIRFLNGNIDSLTVGVGLNARFWRLEQEMKK